MNWTRSEHRPLKGEVRYVVFNGDHSAPEFSVVLVKDGRVHELQSGQQDLSKLSSTYWLALPTLPTKPHWEGK